MSRSVNACSGKSLRLETIGLSSVTTTSIHSPGFSQLVEFLREAHAAGDIVTIFATCSVEYTGNKEGELGHGDRVVICKQDGAVVVHRPTGARAVARQGTGSHLEPVVREDSLLIYAGKGSNETIRVEISNASMAVRFEASDDATLEENQTEEQMHEFIISNPSTIEEGFRIIEHERSTPHGRIDFFGADEEGNTVILEIKQPVAELSHIDQLRRYVSYHQRSSDSFVRGILVAPAFKRNVKRTLRDSDLEWIELDQYQQPEIRPNQTSVEDWTH